MRRLLLIALLALATLGLADTATRAARTSEAQALPGSLELVVFEVDGCAYCGVFRRDVLPSYQVSPQSKNAPIRFVDVNDPAMKKIGLDGDISIVPTFVLLKDNREVGRIPGYFSPDNFFRMLKHLISQAG